MADEQPVPVEHEPWTNQAAFDAVWRYFIVEKNSPGMRDGVCMFRQADGRKCAAGVLIPDDLYEPRMDSELIGIITVIEDCNNLQPLFANVTTGLLGLFQDGHDSSAMAPHPTFHQAFERHLRSAARQFGLTIPTEEAA